MGLASILLAVGALVSATVGFFTTPIPVVGAVFSFLAPALALAGIITGGIAMSRRKRAGQPAEGALAGVILSVVAFLPSLVVAMFCGVCNAAISSGNVHVKRDARFDVGSGFQDSAGAGALPATAGTGGASATPPAAGAAAPGGAPSMPPPPLPAGPRRDAPKPQGR